MQRELAAGDRTMERAFCAGPVDRLTIGMPVIARVDLLDQTVIPDAFGSLERCARRSSVVAEDECGSDVVGHRVIDEIRGPCVESADPAEFGDRESPCG